MVRNYCPMEFGVTGRTGLSLNGVIEPKFSRSNLCDQYRVLDSTMQIDF